MARAAVMVGFKARVSSEEGLAESIAPVGTMKSNVGRTTCGERTRTNKKEIVLEK